VLTRWAHVDRAAAIKQLDALRLERGVEVLTFMY